MRAVKRCSLTLPSSPPSALAPLSEKSRTRVLSSWPVSSRKAEQPADLGVGVGEEPGEDLLLAGVHPPLVGGQRVPGVDPRRPRGEHRAVGDDAAGQLAGEGLFAPGVPALVERAPGRARPTRARHGAVRAWRRTRSTRRTACPARPAAGRARSAPPGRPGPRSGGSRPPGARRRVDVVVVAGRGWAPSGWRHPGGSRSSARSRGRAASCRTARRRTAGTAASGATCRRPSCCSPASRRMRGRVAAVLGSRAV